MKFKILFLVNLFFIINVKAQSYLVISNGNFVVTENQVVLKNTQLINNSTFDAGTGTVVVTGDATDANSAIGGASSTTFYNLTINKTTNNALLNTSASVTNTLTLTNGKLDLQTNNLTIANGGTINGGSANSFIKTSSTGVLIQEVGTTDVIFPIGYTNYTPVTLNNTGTTDNFQARTENTVYINGTSGNEVITDVVDCTWFINEETTGGSNVEMTLQWNGSDEMTNFDRTQSFVAHYTNGIWDNYATQTASGSNPYTLVQNGISSFSPFTVASSAAALPVELLYFYAEKEEQNVRLDWQTATEINNSHFDVEWSDDGVSFEKIGEVEGAGTTNEIKWYDFLHTNPVIGENYYRLKQVDFDGAFEYTNILIIEFKTSNTQTVSIYPNPAIDYFKIESNYEGVAQLFDVSGRLIAEKTISKNGSWDISRLAGGTYFVKIGNDVKKLLVHKP